MADTPEEDRERDLPPADAPGGSPDQAGAAIPRPIQELLGQQLRTTYSAETPDKPAYLGDPALPIEFELLLQRLEASERQRYRQMAHEQGVEAVERALRTLAAGSGEAGAPEPRQG